MNPNGQNTSDKTSTTPFPHHNMGNSEFQLSRFLSPAATTPDDANDISNNGINYQYQPQIPPNGRKDSAANEKRTVTMDTTTAPMTSIATLKPPNPTVMGVAPTLPALTSARPFMTAYGNEIYLSAKKPTFQTPCKNKPFPLTPQQKQANTDRTEGSVIKDVSLEELTDSGTIDSVTIIEKAFRIHHSALLDQKFRPKMEDINLPPELEPLKFLILSQHEVFSKNHSRYR